MTSQGDTTGCSSSAAYHVYVEPLELQTHSLADRKRAWFQWRDGRREDRKWAFARLRDALSLQDDSMIEEWKNRVIELGPDDPDHSMPSFKCHS